MRRSPLARCVDGFERHGHHETFPVAPEGFNAVLGQLARWFYTLRSGAHCNNYYYFWLLINCGSSIKEREHSQALTNSLGLRIRYGIFSGLKNGKFKKSFPPVGAFIPGMHRRHVSAPEKRPPLCEPPS